MIARVLSIGAVLVSACVHIPGETLAPSGLHRDIRDRIYAHAQSMDPQCRQQEIVTTEILELHPGGAVAEERWTLLNCRRKVDYIVSYTPRSTGPARFQIRPAR